MMVAEGGEGRAEPGSSPHVFCLIVEIYGADEDDDQTVVGANFEEDEDEGNFLLSLLNNSRFVWSRHPCARGDQPWWYVGGTV